MLHEDIRRRGLRGLGALLGVALLPGLASGAPWFVAVEVPPSARRVLAQVQGRVAEDVPSLEPTEPEGFHLTLAYLGEVPDASRPRALRLLRAAAADHGPFWLRYCDLGDFPFRESPRPRVLWAGCGGDRSALVELAGSLRAAAALVVGRPPSYPFRPHVTLGRLPAPSPVPGWDGLRERFAGRCFGTHRVEAAWLLEGGAGPRGYPRVERLPLRGADRSRVADGGQGRYHGGEPGSTGRTPASPRRADHDRSAKGQPDG